MIVKCGLSSEECLVAGGIGFRLLGGSSTFFSKLCVIQYQ